MGQKNSKGKKVKDLDIDTVKTAESDPVVLFCHYQRNKYGDDVAWANLSGAVP